MPTSTWIIIFGSWGLLLCLTVVVSVRAKRRERDQ